ncbi:unnamed protein product [Paramecium octaurelia]|uniref:Uncharacterized protein n=1 Tax=Paramecium octaurelia TaxID=43137 RepID=A0A8S1YPA7_PAROT|nr:unnamed protein product [Paramecium octaurelia]
MLRQDNKNPNYMVIIYLLILYVFLLMGLHQHLVVVISLSIYGLFKQDNKKPNYMAIMVGLILASVCFYPNGTLLASGGGDCSIRIWDVKTGQQKSKLDGHSSQVQSVQFSPDGTKLGSGSADKSVYLWDVKTESFNAKQDGHSNYVKLTCFSPDGTTLACCHFDNSIHLWNVQTAKEILPKDILYQDLYTALERQLSNTSIIKNSNFDFTILRISQSLILEMQGALILKGEFINYQGKDLLLLFKSKGSLILEDQVKDYKQKK